MDLATVLHHVNCIRVVRRIATASGRAVRPTREKQLVLVVPPNVDTLAAGSHSKRHIYVQRS